MTNRFLDNANRPLMAAVCFVAALALSACGGEGGEGSRLDSTVPFSERENSSGSTNSGPTTGAESDDAGNVEDSSSIVDESPASGDGASTAEGSGTEDNESDLVDSDSSSPEEGGQASETPSKVVLRWSVPTKRENGEFLPPEELGGYEIRYREVSEPEFRTIPINDALQETHYFDEELSGKYEFQIAAHDVNGLYSEFVTLTAYE